MRASVMCWRKGIAVTREVHRRIWSVYQVGPFLLSIDSSVIIYSALMSNCKIRIGISEYLVISKFFDKI